MRQIAVTRCPRQVAATNRLVWHVKIIVAATEFCRWDLSHEFKLVWIRATNRSDKISGSRLVAACTRMCVKSLRQNLSQPMREHQLVLRHVKFELVYISSLPKSIACTEQMFIAATCRRISADEGTCRRDGSQRFVASCVSALKFTHRLRKFFFFLHMNKVIIVFIKDEVWYLS